MNTEHSIRLTSAEISQIWSTYMNDSLSICVLKYFLEKVEDTEIKPVVEYALQISQKHAQKLSALFQEEKHPIPHGFTDEDVDLGAPRLYSDGYMLHYLLQMGSMGLNMYSVALALAVRSDIHAYFSECLRDSMEIHKRARDISLSKGLYIRSPYISIPEKVDFVKQQSFLTGWFGDKRPLTSLEIANLYANIQRNALGTATLMAFSQVAKDEKVKQYFIRGKEIANKHIDIFSSVMKESDLPVPMTWNSDITDSTISPFSDKLMLVMTTALISMSIGYYGASMSISPRRDIGLHYGRLISEIAQYAEDGANIMIDHAWLEQPPSASDRDKLANNK